ncbi:MAG: pyridoxal-phosphate dependent enzyme [Opitutales bacterium]
MAPPLAESLKLEIVRARQRIYRAAPPTPLDRLVRPDGTTLYLKREDLSPIRAYKWRGAYNCLAQLSPAEAARGVVTASAGNHAQGVALAARLLGLSARIHMPETTPRTKQEAVRRHGGEAVEIVLGGDTFGDASAAAERDREASGRVFVSAYDHPHVIGGQGTIADEIATSGEGPFDAAFLQIGGGGLATGVGLWLKEHFPHIRLIGVEGEAQASFAHARKHGKPTTLERMDIFCDGTAIPRVGEAAFRILDKILDDYLQVSNDEICSAIQELWNQNRCLPEPSGAMGYAGFRRKADKWRGKKVIAIICGANIDFEKLSLIAARAPFGNPARRTWRIRLGEAQGALHRLLDECFADLNLVDFQYGQVHPEVAHHTITFEADEAAAAHLRQVLTDHRIPMEDVSGRSDVRFRVIRFDPRLFRLPLFARIEFTERPGAIREMVALLAPFARLCYLDYQFTGERVGRALVGFDFTSEDERERFLRLAPGSRGPIVHYEPLSADTAARILGTAQ